MIYIRVLINIIMLVNYKLMDVGRINYCHLICNGYDAFWIWQWTILIDDYNWWRRAIILLKLLLFIVLKWVNIYSLYLHMQVQVVILEFKKSITQSPSIDTLQHQRSFKSVATLLSDHNLPMIVGVNYRRIVIVSRFQCII